MTVFTGSAVVGAFTAVASSGMTWRDRCTLIVPERLELPPAVLMHADHSIEAAARPVGVAVPVHAGDRIVIEAVLATWAAADVSSLLRSGAVPAVSIVAEACEFEPDPVRPDRLNLVRGVLAAVDLADVPMDFLAHIEHLTYVEDLSVGQRRTRDALDAYLAAGQPLQIDFLAAFDERRMSVFDPLVPVVNALHGEVARLRRAEDRRRVRVMLQEADRKGVNVTAAPAMAAPSGSKVARGGRSSPADPPAPSDLAAASHPASRPDLRLV